MFGVALSGAFAPVAKAHALGTPTITDACNEETDSCDNVPVDAACDDGLACNGVETCNPNAERPWSATTG